MELSLHFKDSISLSICCYTSEGTPKSGMLITLEDAIKLKAEVFHEKKYMDHQNGRLKTLHNLTLDITLTHQQQYLYFNFMKQSTSKYFVLWRYVNIDEVVLLHRDIIVELHHRDLFQVVILSQLTLESPFWCYFKMFIRKIPQNDLACCHFMTIVMFVQFFQNLVS